MSEKLQGFALLLTTIGGQEAVDVLFDGIVFPHTFFQASVLSVEHRRKSCFDDGIGGWNAK